MPIQFERLLHRLGFSQNEAKVYLACLQLGVNSAQHIAQKATLQRTTTYSVLGLLVKRGVVGKTKIRGKSRFLAEPPHKLLAVANELQTNVQQVLPELEAIYNRSEVKPKIVFYEGERAIQAVYDDTLREKPGEILEWNTDAYFGSARVDQRYIQKRVALGISAKRIAGAGSRWDTEHRRRDTTELSETRIVPREAFWPEVEVNIYGNKVAFMNYAEQMSVIIESKGIAQAMRQAYALSWQGAAAMIRNDINKKSPA